MKKHSRELLIGSFSLCLGALFFTGCTHTQIVGSGWSAQNTSLLWSRKNLSGTINTNGSATFSEDESTPDSKSIAALTQLALALAAKGAGVP